MVSAARRMRSRRPGVGGRPRRRRGKVGWERGADIYLRTGPFHNYAGRALGQDDGLLLDDAERIDRHEIPLEERRSLVGRHEPIRWAHRQDLDQREPLAVELRAKR